MFSLEVVIFQRVRALPRPKLLLFPEITVRSVPPLGEQRKEVSVLVTTRQYLRKHVFFWEIKAERLILVSQA
jgi:hypothetical protein